MKTGLLSLLLVLVLGCSAQHWGGDTAGKRPGVKFETGWFIGTKIEMTSDGMGTVSKVSIEKTKDGYVLALDNLTLNQEPSINTKAEVDKLKAIEDLQRVQVEYAKEITQWVKALTQMMMPIASSWPSLLAYGAGQALTAYVTPAPTTQPVATQPATIPSE